MTTLMVHGINCAGCKATLEQGLLEVEGLQVVSIGTKKESGRHPNKVVVRGASLTAVAAAIAKVDDGREKFTVDLGGGAEVSDGDGEGLAAGGGEEAARGNAAVFDRFVSHADWPAKRPPFVSYAAPSRADEERAYLAAHRAALESSLSAATSAALAPLQTEHSAHPPAAPLSCLAAALLAAAGLSDFDGVDGGGGGGGGGGTTASPAEGTPLVGGDRKGETEAARAAAVGTLRVALGRAVNAAMRALPEDPLGFVARHVEAQAAAPSAAEQQVKLLHPMDDKAGASPASGSPAAPFAPHSRASPALLQ